MDQLPRIGADAVPGLVESLKDPHPGVRRTAVQNLGRIGSAALRCFPELVTVMADADVEVRRAATWALGEFGPVSVFELISCLNDPELVITAERALRRINREVYRIAISGPAVEDSGKQYAMVESSGISKLRHALEKAFSHRDEDIRTCGVYVIGRTRSYSHQEKLEQLERSLADDCEQVRMVAAYSIGELTGWELDTRSEELLLGCACRDLLSSNGEIQAAARRILLLLHRQAAGFICNLLREQDLTRHQSQQLLEVLALIAEDAGHCVPLLIELLEAEAEHHPQMIRTLAIIGRGHQAAMNCIVRLCANPQDKRAVAPALADVGIPAERAVPLLLAYLDDRDDETRLAAGEALGTMDSDAAQVVSDLCTAAEPVPVSTALEAFTRLGRHAAVAVPLISGWLDKGELEIRRKAATTLGYIGPAAEQAIPALTRAMQHDDQQLSRRAIASLGLIGRPAVSELLKVIGGGQAEQQVVAALDALDKVDSLPEEAVEPIARLLLSGTPQVQAKVAQVLQNLGGQAVIALDIYEQALMHHDRQVRSHASKILSSLESSSIEAVPALLKLLQFGRIPARKQAAIVLSTIAQYSDLVVPSLRKLLRSRDKDVVVPAAIALGSIGAQAGPAASDLIRSLTHRKSGHSSDYRLVSGTIVRESSSALARIGPQAIPAIIDSLEKRKVSMKDRLLSLLPIWGALEPPVVGKPRLTKYLLDIVKDIGANASDAVPVLCEILQDTDNELRTAAAESIKSIGRISDSSVILLAKALDHRDARVRSHAADVLSGFGRQSRLAVPGLIQAVKDRDIEVKKKAIIALSAIGPAAREATPALIGELDSPNREITHITTEAIQNIGPILESHLQQIGSLLKHKDSNVRRSAALILGSAGAPARLLLPDLQKLLQDKDRSVASEVEHAIAKLNTL